MEIKITLTFEKAKQYHIKTKKNCTDANGLWTKHMIEPFWGDIICKHNVECCLILRKHAICGILLKN